MEETMAHSANAVPDTDAQSEGGAVREKASEAAGQAQEKAQQATEQAKSKLRTQVDQRSADAGAKLSTTADDIRAVGEQLRAQGKDGPAKLADQAAERANELGGYLSRSDADRILGDIEAAARRQPWAVIAGGLALGFVASRFLKASSGERYRTSLQGRSAAPRQLETRMPGNGHSGGPIGTMSAGSQPGGEEQI
jgi:hypothetical protein